MEGTMAVYRSDQAQLTFGVEAAPGGYPEIAVMSSLSGSVVTKSGVNHAAGSSSLQLAAATGMAADVIVCIGGGVANQEQELRRVEHVIGSGTSTVIYLDAPTAFYHAAGTAVQVATGTVTDADADKFMTIVPGVYETIDVPDPDMTIEARYFLGTASKRNFFSAYKGQQTYSGALPGFLLLDGRPLRFPIGKVVTTPSALQTETILINNTAGTKKGDVYVAYDGSDSANIAVDSYVNIDAGSATLSEVRKVVVDTNTIMKLDYPLQFAHDNNAVIKRVNTASGLYYTHSIIETVDLDTISWHVHMRDSGEVAANDFNRRYYGGLVGAATLAADEGGMLTMSWDGINFMGMVHNQKFRGSETVPFYGEMQSITQDGTNDIVFPTSDPYYFSQGSVKLFGQTIARIRNFSLSITNNEEPRYYIQQRFGKQRGPSEIREQRREYSLAVTLALPDTTTNVDTTTTLFKELLMEGDFGGAGMQGFNIELRFDRGTNDYIIIRIPDDYTGTSGGAAVGGNEQGAFIRTAPHAVTGDNPLQVDADILFRNLIIEVKDATHYYP